MLPICKKFYMKKINSKLFKQAMSKFATGITVITINNKNQYIGKTVNSFAALSLKPSLVLFSLDKKSTSLKFYNISKYIGINILTSKQKKISSHFSLKNPQWDSTNSFITSNNLPMILDALVNLECKKIKTISQGDHIIFICEIINLKINDKFKPLIYLNSEYI
jgi:flavin reductase (DIM6/NTAB) family NADH-FMN oxidoreductase RutF